MTDKARLSIDVPTYAPRTATKKKQRTYHRVRALATASVAVPPGHTYKGVKQTCITCDRQHPEVEFYPSMRARPNPMCVMCYREKHAANKKQRQKDEYDPEWHQRVRYWLTRPWTNADTIADICDAVMYDLTPEEIRCTEPGPWYNQFMDQQPK